MTLTDTNLVPWVGDKPQPVITKVDNIALSGLPATHGMRATLATRMIA